MKIIRNLLILALACLAVLIIPQCASAQTDDHEPVALHDMRIHDTPGRMTNERVQVNIGLRVITIIHNLSQPAFVVVTRCDGSRQFAKLEPCDMPHSESIHNTRTDDFVEYKVYRPGAGIISFGRIVDSGKK